MRCKLIHWLAGIAICFSCYCANAEELVFCRPNNMVSAFPYIAEQQGFFKEEGLNFRFETATNAKICNDMMVAGKADVTIGGDGPFTYLSAYPHNLRLIAFGGYGEETRVFARKDRGITRFEDLKGKKIGFLPGTVCAFFLYRVADKYNLKLNELTLISMQPPTMTQALIGGVVDAIIIWEPWGSNAMKTLGDNGIELTDPKAYSYHLLLSVTEEIASSRPEVPKALLRALIKAEKYFSSNKEEVIPFLSKAIAFDQPILEKIWPTYHYKVDLNLVSVNLLEENFRWLQKTDEKFSNIPAPDFRKFINPTFLKEIAPERVDESFNR